MVVHGYKLITLFFVCVFLRACLLNCKILDEMLFVSFLLFSSYFRFAVSYSTTPGAYSKDLQCTLNK